MLNLFRMARQGLNLTPGQRAALKLVKGFALAGVVVAVPVVVQALALPSVNWRLTIEMAAGAFAVAALSAASKYYTSQGDAPLAQVLGTVAGAVRGPMLPSFQTMQDTGVVATATSAPSSASVGSPAAAASGAGDASTVVAVQDAPAAS